MKLLFIVFDNLCSNSSHLVRLAMSLNYLSKKNKVSILCLTTQWVYPEQEKKYPKVDFYYYPIQYNGRYVKNLDDIILFIKNISNILDLHMIIQTLEIWDIIRELSLVLSDKSYSVVFHAMPFLWTPISPSWDFEKDVIAYYNSWIDDYRIDYIKNNYKQFNCVLSKINIIAANSTVNYYFNNYLKDTNIFILENYLISPMGPISKNQKNIKYDFVYMARIEKGKWLEFLSKILTIVSNNIGRRVSIAILWTLEDSFSISALNELKSNNLINVSYFWRADNLLKKEVFSNSWVFIYPSYYDTYSIVLAEALWAWLPCIVWDVPYTRNNYKNISNIKRIKLYDYNSFANTAIELLKQYKKFNNKSLLDLFNNLENRIGVSDLSCYTNIYRNDKKNK